MERPRQHHRQPRGGDVHRRGQQTVEIRNNRISHAGDGIIVDARDSRVARNRISRIEEPPGCPKGGCATGIAIEGARDNRVVRNRVSHGDGPGIRLGVKPRFVPSNFRIHDNLVRANLLVRDGDGILVEPNAVDSALLDNRTRRFHDAGIDVRRPSTTLIGNRANGNRHLGIDAVANVRDGGGNRARQRESVATATGAMWLRVTSPRSRGSSISLSTT